MGQTEAFVGLDHGLHCSMHAFIRLGQIFSLSTSYECVAGFIPICHCRFASLHYASLFLFMKMPCISQSECHVAPPPQPLPNSHLHMNLLHSTEPDI